MAGVDRRLGACPVKHSIQRLAAVLPLWLAVALTTQGFAPLIAYGESIPVRPDAVTVLLGADGQILGPMTEQYVGLGKRGWLSGFNKAGNAVQWEIDAPNPDEYLVSILGGGHGSTGTLPAVEVTVGDTKLQAGLREPVGGRQAIGKFEVPAGKTTVSVRLMNNEPLEMFYSVELVRPSVRAQMEQDAASSRADTSWLVDGKYGFMFHWTSQSQPRYGQAKSYQQAVRDFDLEGFVDSVDQMGAGHVIFTTSHAGFWFPGPNDAIDKILPGRTSSRDLIGEMADALGERGIRLMLYFHPGHDDEPWWDAVGFDQNKPAFFDNWSDIIADAGNRYGDRLAGWFFDDAQFTYYPYSPDWKKMTKAARAGNENRLVSYNSWQYNRVTPYQDVFFGESAFSHDIIQGFGNLEPNGSGVLAGGRYKSLQAHIMTITEGDWVHAKPDAEIGPVIHKLNDLVWGIQESIKYRNVPTFNLEIYQDGSLSDKTVDVFTKISAAIHDSQMPEGYTEAGPHLGQVEEGTILLEAQYGQIHGEGAGRGGTEYIGGWGVASTFVSWEFEAPEPGEYTVIIQAACASDHGGEFEVILGETVLPATVLDTGSFSNPQFYAVGTVVIPESTTTCRLLVKPIRIKYRKALMNLHSVRLVPGKGDHE